MMHGFMGVGRRPKYRNVRRKATATDPGSEYNGRVYASKAEARYAAELERMVEVGLIKAWVPQVSLPLPPPFKGRRMVIDFMVVWSTGAITWHDVKGMAPARDWQLKREAVQNAYGIEIKIEKPRKN